MVKHIKNLAALWGLQREVCEGGETYISRIKVVGNMEQIMWVVDYVEG